MTSSKTGTTVPQSMDVKIPTSKELYEFFDVFFQKWAKIPSDYFSWPEEGPLPFPMEEGILFSQPLNGLIVVRTSLDFGNLLTELAQERKQDESKRNALFTEMTVLFWHKFAMKFWQLDSRRITPAILRHCVPAEWPDRKPQSACLAFVKEYPVEIRLWTGLTDQEIQAWRKSRG